MCNSKNLVIPLQIEILWCKNGVWSRIARPGTYIMISAINYNMQVSLSTLVLNSRDWSEIVWLPEISRFKINLAISFIRKKLAGMHWLGYNDTVSSLNEAKTRIFQPTANFENFEIHLYLVSQPACRKTRLR